MTPLIMSSAAAAAAPSYLVNHDPIFLYGGAGAEPSVLAKTCESYKEQLGGDAARLITVDSSYLIRELGSNISGIIIPGGNASSIYSALGIAGVNKVREFVMEKKGFYIGHCAGCYISGPYTCRLTKWLAPLADEGRHFNFSPNHLSGPAINIYKHDNMLSEKTAGVASITFGFKDTHKRCSVFWNGGGKYQRLNHNEHLAIAQYGIEGEFAYAGYATLPTNKTGPMVFCNVHPEVQLQQDEVQHWCPSASVEERTQLVADIPLQKEFVAGICKYVKMI